MSDKKENLIGEKLTEQIDYVSRKQLKKKNLIMIMIVSFFVILISLITFFVFFNNSIIGSWSKSGDGIHYVLTFKDDGSIIVSKDSISLNGTYSLKEDNVVSFDVPMNSRSFMSGDYKYNIISNFSDKRLELIDDKGNKEEYNQYQLKEPEGLKDFPAKESLLGRWKNDEFGIEYEFYNDGLATVKKDNMTITFHYNVDDKTIVLKGKVSGGEQESKIAYTIEENILKIFGVDYIKQ